jgi:hypothetical protein
MNHKYLYLNSATCFGPYGNIDITKRYLRSVKSKYISIVDLLVVFNDVLEDNGAGRNMW